MRPPGVARTLASRTRSSAPDVPAPDEPTRSPALTAQRPNKNRPATPPSTSRRERREALRREQGGRPARSSTAKPPAWKSPIALVSALAVVVAIGLIVVLGMKPGSASVDLVAPLSDVPVGAVRDGRSLGAATAPVQLDSWEDIQCPSCGQYSSSVQPRLIREFVLAGTLRLTYHDFSFLGPESFDAASAARCAGEQDRFWEYNDWVYANQKGENEGRFSRDRLEAIAVKVGLDKAAWGACYDGGSNRQAITDETAQGKALGVDSTPTIFVNGQQAPSPSYEVLAALIRAAADAAGTSASPVASASPGASTTP